MEWLVRRLHLTQKSSMTSPKRIPMTTADEYITAARCNAPFDLSAQNGTRRDQLLELPAVRAASFAFRPILAVLGVCATRIAPRRRPRSRSRTRLHQWGWPPSESKPAHRNAAPRS